MTRRQGALNATRNQAKAGVTDVQWLRGNIENIPLPRDSVDVIISTTPDMDDATRATAYTGCIAGALTREEFADALQTAGLPDLFIAETHRVTSTPPQRSCAPPTRRKVTTVSIGPAIGRSTRRGHLMLLVKRAHDVLRALR